MIYERYFLQMLFVTVVIESIVVILLIPKDIQIQRRLSAAILPTALTLPYIWLIFPNIIGIGDLYRYSSEIFAIAVEGYLIYLITSIDIKRAFYISFVANISSFLLAYLFHSIK